MTRYAALSLAVLTLASAEAAAQFSYPLPKPCAAAPCDAPTPACGQTATGQDGCGQSCSKTGPSCCVMGPCAAPEPLCGQATTGQDGCGQSCSKTGPPCAVPAPAGGQGAAKPGPAAQPKKCGGLPEGRACWKVSRCARTPTRSGGQIHRCTCIDGRLSCKDMGCQLCMGGGSCGYAPICR